MNGYQLKNQHLLWRAGFGPSIGQLKDISRQRPEHLFREILKASEKKPVFFDVADSEVKDMVMSSQSPESSKMLGLKPEEKQMLRKQSVRDIFKLNIRWLQEMTESPAQLREKMSLFWHGHFATKTVNILYDQELLNIIREHALGSFRDLLVNVSKSASMIRFLNNNQNKKGHPNENFARELMELFTIGRGNYTETDVKESARAFTGWNADVRGTFDFHPRQHDDGIKVFMGKTGNFSGEDILNILLDQKQTAVFITRKIYRYFVNDVPSEEIVNSLANRFFENNYNIQDLLSGLFTASWFYDAKNIGSQIKSPILWMVGIRRQLPMEIQNPGAQLLLERLLGQVLFSPPNVAGWPGGKYWIDSSSLMLRMQLPRIIEQSDEVRDRPKDDDDLMMGMRFQEIPGNLKKIRNATLAQFHTEIYWDQYAQNFNKLPEIEMFPAIRDFLLQKNGAVNENMMIRYIDESNRDARIKSITIRIMGTPEYQLC